MKAGKKPGLLCRSQAATAVCQSHTATAVCRSHASIAACVPADPRAAAVVPPPRWSNEVRYARLGGDARRVAAGGDRIQAVTLPMVTTRERAPPPEPKARLRPTCSSNATSATTASVVPALTSARDQLFQVVVMRVSLHCQGCAGKVRKHISKMEGVTSFSIDLESKRVTVMGHVSPVGVLESISKVKKAEFWTC